ncbi:Protein OPI10 [Erysiphe neolycopersici]|uniref:Protein OPI10 n=1 Tax=Erysiphe neolycopersici TaxID=212602 RepID=A0A420HW94_9PEZI|nr:Protein OPI10 [Erysiphe neolycopersici]
MDEPVIPQLFGLIPTGSPVIIIPTTVPSPTSYTYNIPIPTAPRKPFSHLTIFLLPGVALPPSSAAAVYLALPQAPTEFRLLGAIGQNKESAVFKISGLGVGAQDLVTDAFSGSNVDGVTEIDMDAPDEILESTTAATLSTSEIVIGISIEPAELVATQLAALQATSSAKPISSSTVVDATNQSVVIPIKTQPDTLILAQRIIKDAFNFVSSYSSSGSVGEMVPLKIFEEWWKKFESKVKIDPSFLEKASID